MKPVHPRFRRQQRGVSIFLAIFLLLLFGVLAALMARMISTASVSEVQDIEGARTYQAARAGVEWGMYQLDPDGATAALPSCFAPATLNQIPGYSVEVRCTPYPGAATTYTEGSKTMRLFLIVAKASATKVLSPGVERQVEVTIERCRDSNITAAPYDC